MEYRINVEFTVDAKDHDQAVDIAKEARNVVIAFHGYKLRDVETSKIEEL